MTSAGSKSAALIPGHERPAEFVVRGWEWTKRLGAVGGAQLVVQGFSFASGIMIVRWLPTKQYALYTLANTLLGTLSVISDGGISSGVMAQGGKVWQDRSKLGAVIATGRSLRRQFAIGTLLLWAPFFIWQFREHGAPWSDIAIILLVVIGYFWAAFLSTIYAVAPNLWQRLRDTQRIAVEQNLIRLGCLGGSLLAFPTAVTAVGATLVGQGWSVFRLKRISSRLVDLGQSENAEIRREVLKITKRVLPSAIYFCISSQLMIWLISVFGTNAGLAQIGALGRLGQVFTVFSGIATAAIAPRFARLPAQRNLIARRYFQVMTLFAVAGCGIVILVALFSRQVLWILGPEYAGLTREVVLAAAGSAMYFLVVSALALTNARGIVISPWRGIMLNFAAQVILLSALNVHTVAGVLWFGILAATFDLLLYTGNFLIVSGWSPVVRR